MARKSNNTALNALATGLNSGFLDNALESEITFAAATTGAVSQHTLATITGTVAISVIGICTTNLVSAGGGTISVGTAVTVDGLIAVTTGTDLDAGEIWHDAAPDSDIELTSVVLKNILTEDLTYDVLVGTLTAGAVKFLIRWAPLSADGNVVIA